MAMMKVFALASSWAVCSVQADPCLTASGGEYKISTLVLANIKCDSTSSVCTAGSTAGKTNCPCGTACCVRMPGVCSAIKSSNSCGTDRLYDGTKKAVAATATNYDANCCKAKGVCSAHTCGTGYKDKTSKATLKCTIGTCSNAECCDSVPCTDCCMSMMRSGTSCPSATHYNYDHTAGATAANFEANCCAVKKEKTCDATCSAGMKQKAAYATTKCAIFSLCSEAECCETDTTKCLAVTAACDANSFKDTAKNGVAGTTATVQTACCSAKTTCQQFSVHVDTAFASFAMLPQVHTVTFFFAIGLFIAGK